MRRELGALLQLVAAEEKTLRNERRRENRGENRGRELSDNYRGDVDMGNDEVDIDVAIAAMEADVNWLESCKERYEYLSNLSKL